MSLEALLHIDQGGVSVSDEQIAKNFDSENDRLNWRILCEILDRFVDQVDTLGDIVDVLIVLSNQFIYIASSLEWLKAQLKALRTTPMQFSEQSNAISWFSTADLPKSRSQSFNLTAIHRILIKNLGLNMTRKMRGLQRNSYPRIHTIGLRLKKMYS